MATDGDETYYHAQTRYWGYRMRYVGPTQEIDQQKRTYGDIGLVVTEPSNACGKGELCCYVAWGGDDKHWISVDLIQPLAVIESVALQQRADKRAMNRRAYK